MNGTAKMLALIVSPRPPRARVDRLGGDRWPRRIAGKGGQGYVRCRGSWARRGAIAQRFQQPSRKGEGGAHAQGLPKRGDKNDVPPHHDHTQPEKDGGALRGSSPANHPSPHRHRDVATRRARKPQPARAPSLFLFFPFLFGGPVLPTGARLFSPAGCCPISVSEGGCWMTGRRENNDDGRGCAGDVGVIGLNAVLSKPSSGTYGGFLDPWMMPLGVFTVQ
ncbi:hypothetical protein CSOJ01_01836 [Colletotrichum sojae]|uniref:Uncharacterized protein n=1 Tax=Colletotrichum sojae TaxID=2175907 RepID=A0A8H6JTH9_9PEZI|nr:hypothetical protein CSOJ01_01836 [Colletotrichum sojae]